FGLGKGEPRAHARSFGTEVPRDDARPEGWFKPSHYFDGVQKGSRAGTNWMGTPVTKVFNQRVHSSMPACSDGMWPRMISDFCLPSLTASATYSTVSHSRASPISSTCTPGISSARA